MPSYVLRLAKGFSVARPQAVGGEAAGPIFAVPEMVGRSCRLEPYEARKIPKIALEAGAEAIAYASPDSTFAVTKRLMDAAERSILIGIYDFSAPHMREVLLNALARGVSVSLMLDIDSDSENREFDKLVEMGVRGVPAPSCAHDTIRFFSSSHEKVIVIDDEWCLVQSGNYSSNSIPLNERDGGGATGFRTGNRDSGLAIRSPKLAALFTEILEADMALVEATPEMLRRPLDESVFLVERVPRGPKKRFKSEAFTFADKLTVTPVLSPDNYMLVVPDLLRKARVSVLIEQQYIKANQTHIRTLLGAIKQAREKSPKLDVRIVLGKVFNKSKLKAERENLQILADDYGLELGTHIRYVNTDQFVHCHNKMVLIDGEGVLVSSQNWSDSAVSKNREAGVWLKHEGVGAYFTSIFEFDWSVSFRELPGDEAEPEMLTSEALAGGGFVRVERADYEEV
ncbi:MAG: phospholipase D-like domain-containing protein [Hyphomicrobium sp.]|jgi:phosphatidylserine/phosphatidylglycerophosphate/cardiolipin synthase-like enzyme